MLSLFPELLGWNGMTIPRLLVAVEPVLLEAVLARLLQSWRHVCVVEYHQGETPPTGTFDAVISTELVPSGITAATHICLPAEGRAGTAVVTRGDHQQPATVESYRDLFAILEQSL